MSNTNHSNLKNVDETPDDDVLDDDGGELMDIENEHDDMDLLMDEEFPHNNHHFENSKNVKLENNVLYCLNDVYSY